MACKIPYIEKQPFSETEKNRLSDVHVKIFKQAKESKAFRASEDRLYSLKNLFSKATDFVAKTNDSYGFTISRLQKDKNGSFLSVDVTPLAEEQQLPLLQLEGTESSKASKDTIDKVKQFLKSINVDLKSDLQTIVVNGKKVDANAAALIMQKVIQVVTGKEDVALVEEAMHFAVEILENNGDPLFGKMLSEINSYNTYKKVLADYGSNPLYQTPDGRPDIRKLKKEAIGKVLAEVTINKNEGKTEKPELIAKTQTWWESIIEALKRIFYSSGFDQTALKILSGESIGSADNLSDTTYLQVEGDTQKSIIDKIKSISSTISKKDDGYYIGDKKVKYRVSDISKTWYENRFADKNLTKSEYSKAVDDLKAEKGTAGHADIEYLMKNHFLDSEGRLLPVAQRGDDSGYVSQINPNNKEMYSLLKRSLSDRLQSFPEGTMFMAEATVYDPKRDLAGTIDFIAVEPSGKIHLLDWKFTDLNTEKYEDIPWYKIGAWNTQMKNYKNILKYAYNFKFDGTEQTRMIPIKVRYSPGNSKQNILPRLESLEIGNVELKNEVRAYLLPVGLPEERTGDKRIDSLIEKLSTVYETLSSKKTTEEKKPQKAEQLNALYHAIRQLKMRQQIKPLLNQAKVINKEVKSIIDEYNTKDFSALSIQEKNDFADRILTYEDSLQIYVDLYNSLKTVFSGELTDDEKTLKEDLRDTVETANELESDLEDVRKDFSENVVAKSENILDFLKPEKVIKGFSRWFGSTSTLQSKSIQLLYRVVNRAYTFAAMDTVDQANKLKDIKSSYDTWAKSKGLTSSNYFDILKKKGSNELIDEFDPKFYKTLKEKTHDKDREWVKDNIDVEKYKEFLKNKKEEEYKRIETKTRPVDALEASYIIKAEKHQADQLYDISGSDSPGWLLYQYTSKFPKRDLWETKEWKDLHKVENKPALDFYEYIVGRNEHYQKIGYIVNARTFLPFIRKSLMEKILVGGDLKLGEELLRNITVSESDVGYGEINPITKEPIYRIPKYFTKDTGDQFSEDLFRNMTLLNEMALRYEYLSEVEDTLRLISRTEANKDAIKTSFFGKTKYKADGEIETTSDNTENSKLYNDMMEAIVYGHRYVESENFDQLLGSLGNFGKNLNKKLGYDVFPESFDNSQISLNKTITQLNNVFQIKTLGLNPISALSNFLGGTFQGYINAGTYFTKAEFAKNEFVIASRLNGIDSKKYIGALQYFLPLTENYNQILAKDLSLNKLSNEGIQDFLMILMRKSDQYVQTVNFFSYLDNTIVEDGKLVNARESLRASEKYKDIYNVSSKEREKLEAAFEKDVAVLLKEKSVLKIAKIEGNNLVIPGVDRKSESVVDLRRKVQSLTKDALGNLSEDDIRKINLNIYGKSFMIFKNWIPRLVDTRFGNLKYNSASDAYEWGRTRMMFRTLSENTLQSLGNLTSAVLGNDEKWVNQMKDLFQKKKDEYQKDTGKELQMSERQFVELTRKNIQNQMTDFVFYLTLTAIFMTAQKLEPDDDENKYVRNQYKFMLRVMDKVRDEIAYFYNPTSLINLTTSGIFPSLSYINNFEKLFRNFGKEMYAIGVGDEKAQDKNYVVKYLLKGFPVTSQFDSIFLMFYPDLAKDLGMRAQSESRPIGR